LITLREVNRENFGDVIDLSVSDVSTVKVRKIFFARLNKAFMTKLLKLNRIKRLLSDMTETRNY